MNVDAAEWDPAAARDAAGADRAEVAWAVPVRRGPEAPACARNAAIVNRMRSGCPAYRSSARSAAPR